MVDDKDERMSELTELIGDLRAMDWDYCHEMPHNSSCNARDAADALEAQEAGIAELIRRLDIAVAALEQIASYHDTMAQKRFNKTGDFGCFGEPSSVKAARTALLKMEIASFGEAVQ